MGAAVMGVKKATWRDVEVAVEADHREPVRVTVIGYRGNHYVDVRHMYVTKEGELAHTPRGIRLPVQDMANLIASLLQAMCLSGDMTPEEAMELVIRAQ